MTAPQDTGSAGGRRVERLREPHRQRPVRRADRNQRPERDLGRRDLGIQTGADTLIGLGGNDGLDGYLGSDTASYARGGTGPVTVNLGPWTAEHRRGRDGHDHQHREPSRQRVRRHADGRWPREHHRRLRRDPRHGGLRRRARPRSRRQSRRRFASGLQDRGQRPEGLGRRATGRRRSDQRRDACLSAERGRARGVEVSVDPRGLASCAAGCEPPPLTDSASTPTFRAINLDERPPPRAQSQLERVTIDTLAANVEVASGPSGVTANASPTFGSHPPTPRPSSAASTAARRCLLGARDRAVTGHLDDGDHSFSVRATDAAGNSALAGRWFRSRDPPDTKLKKPRVRGDDVTSKLSSDERGRPSAASSTRRS